MLAGQRRPGAESGVGRYRKQKCRTECQRFQFRLSRVTTRAEYCAREGTVSIVTDVSGPAHRGVLYVTV
jgi:hypothetical protein